jgi:hypothetical protein
MVCHNAKVVVVIAIVVVFIAVMVHMTGKTQIKIVPPKTWNFFFKWNFVFRNQTNSVF